MPWRATRQRSFWTGRFMAGVAIQWNIWYNLYIYIHDYTHIYIYVYVYVYVYVSGMIIYVYM
jgi:hypothetical protein